MIKHIVLFKLSESIDKQNKLTALKEIKSIFSPLEKLKCVKEYTVGINISDSEHAWDIVIDSLFESMTELEEYSESEEHKDAVRKAKQFPKVKGVIDYKI